MKAALQRFWRRFSGWVVCAIALVLPYSARMYFVRALNYVANRPSRGAALLLRGPARFWNRVLLALVFFLGFPFARLALLFKRRPRPDSAWVDRPAPEDLERHVEDPF